MSLKNLLLPFFVFFSYYSAFSISAPSVKTNGNDTSVAKKPIGTPVSEMDQNRLLLLDATLELNEALLAGVNASLDTLNVPAKTTGTKNDTIEKLRLMKREREHREMKTYLDYMKDSLTTECKKIKTEKQSIETRLGVAPKKEADNSGNVPKQPELAKNIAVPVNPVEVKNEPVKPVDLQANKTPEKATAVVVQSTKAPDVKAPENKTVVTMQNAPPLDTFSRKPPHKAGETTAITSKKDKKKVKTVSSPDTSGDQPLAPVVKAAVLDNRNTAVNNPVQTATNTDTAMRIKSRSYVAYAQKAVLEKNYPKALDYLNTSIALWQDNYDAWFVMAGVDEQAVGLAKALQDYQHCYGIDSLRPKLFYEMGLLSVKSGDREHALMYLDKSIALDAGYSAAYLKRASLYNDSASYDKAIADYNHVLDINIKNYAAYKGRGFSKLMERSYKDAIDDFTRYIIYDQSDAEVYYYRGLAKISNNEWLDGCLELSMSASMGYTAAALAAKKNCE